MQKFLSLSSCVLTICENGEIMERKQQTCCENYTITEGVISLRKKEMIAMLLAGGQGSRLGVLTSHKAKPAVSFGGKYRIIDFPLSNCINSGIDTVGVLTQYMPLQLNQHIGIGVPWDLDRRTGGAAILAPFTKGEAGEWYRGTADAIFQNIDYIDQYNPEYVLILSGDHIYKMDYAHMLDFHKRTGSDVSIAALTVPMEEASRFGIMNVDGERIYEFEEKPAEPKSNLANMGIYIFNWDVLRDALERGSKKHEDLDFGSHVLPTLLAEGKAMHAYPFEGYWKDVGTVESYWEANMDLHQTVPAFNLYEDFHKIYTDMDHQPPVFTGEEAEIQGCIAAEGCEIYGKVRNSVLGANVYISKGAVVEDSIIMSDSQIGQGANLSRCIIDTNCIIGDGVMIGVGHDIVNADNPKVYNTGITVVGENSTIPDNVVIGKNCVVFGITDESDYPNNELDSGQSIIKEFNASGVAK